jgi:hypothetical protein
MASSSQGLGGRDRIREVHKTRWHGGDTKDELPNDSGFGHFGSGWTNVTPHGKRAIRDRTLRIARDNVTLGRIDLVVFDLRAIYGAGSVHGE